jgi:CHAT domain-containing protein/Tfp pilus assembly protein PilF
MMRNLRRHFFFGGVTSWRLFALVSASVAILPARGLAPLQNGSAPAPQASTAQIREESIALAPGKPIERTITGSEKHSYQLTLQKGQCALIHVEQRGIDVALQLLGSDNDPVIEVDDEIGKLGTEKLDIVAENDGIYKLQVKPKVRRASGAYEIRLVEVRTATDQDRTLDEVRQLRTKANHLLVADKQGEALPLAQRALTLAQGTLGADNVYVALLTRDLAEITYQSGKSAEAQQGFEQALQVLRAKLGAEHPQTIFTKSRLGYVYVDLEDFSKADQLLSQALESEERTLGRNDPLLVETLRSLAILHLHRGDYAAMEREFERALAILEGAGSTEGLQYGQVLNGLGILYIIQHKFDKAGTYLERALAIFERKLGPESPSVSKILNNLGVVARRKKDYTAAEKYYLRELELIQKSAGPEDPGCATALSNLGNVYSSEGDYPKALAAHLRALSIIEKTSDTGASRRMELDDIARTYAALGDFENANKMQSRLESVLESEVALNLAIGSERERLAYLDSLTGSREIMDHTISLHLQFQPDNSEAAALAATALLRRKGRVLDAMTDTLGTLRKHSDPQDQVLLDQLKETTTQLARVALQGPQKQSPDDYRAALQDLQEKKEKLENAISHHNEEFRAQLQSVTLEAVASAIPADSALVEFVTYSPFNSRATTEEQYGDLRYAAYVLHRNTAPKGVDLGEAKAIHAAVEKLRAALREPNRSDAQQLAQAVAKKVFQPLQPLVADDKRLLISPDGQLDLIPFEALLDGQGRYLVERFSITYLTTGRDLLRMQVPRPSRSVPVLVADPLFGEPKGTLVASAALPQVNSAHARTARRSVTTGADLSSLYFAPLAGTRTEAQSIHALFPEARVLTGEQASEGALEQLNAPKILHIATHGFFLQDTTQADAHAGSNGPRGGATADPVNPLLRSGLALSGANLVQDGRGDGILTALEASNLNLWGTKLVTLSACDTGVGEVRNGEGVYGLRRSFFLAGTETLVMSLWPVSDYVTREMMTSYYSGLKHGLGRGEALRQAQLAMLKRKGRRHPFYWASFIQSGEWANLDGQR